jgi:hypothetical protein
MTHGVEQIREGVHRGRVRAAYPRVLHGGDHGWVHHPFEPYRTQTRFGGCIGRSGQRGAHAQRQGAQLVSGHGTEGHSFRGGMHCAAVREGEGEPDDVHTVLIGCVTRLHGAVEF